MTSSERSRTLLPVLLMVSGGSDSEAMLEMAAAGELGCDYANACWHVLHVNHQLRGADADADEAFVVRRCAELGVACTVKRVDVAAIAAAGKTGLEAAAREQRYLLADAVLDAWCAHLHVDPALGVICTAHTLDDRLETFFMRTLVGTGPGGLASIPRRRGRIRRPLLDATREELRCWLREQHPGVSEDELWREDATNDDGSNFRSRVRHELVPVLRCLRPGFEQPLARTMDLIAEEDAAQQSMAEALVYRNLVWDGTLATMPVDALACESRPLARRMLRCMLLVVEPDARLETSQIERVLDNMDCDGFTTETSGGIRVRIVDRAISCCKVVDA